MRLSPLLIAGAATRTRGPAAPQVEPGGTGPVDAVSMFRTPWQVALMWTRRSTRPTATRPERLRISPGRTMCPALALVHSRGSRATAPLSWGPPPPAIRKGYRDDVPWQCPMSQRDWSPAFVCRHMPLSRRCTTHRFVHVNGDRGAPALFRGWYTARQGRRWRDDVPSLRLGPPAPDRLESSCDLAPRRAYQQSGLVRSRSALRSFLRQRAPADRALNVGPPSRPLCCPST